MGTTANKKDRSKIFNRETWKGVGNSHRSTPRFTKTTRLAWVFVISALLLILTFTFAVAVHDDGLFELGDGGDPPNPGSADILGSGSQGGPDWADIFIYDTDAEKVITDFSAFPEGIAALFIADGLASKGETDPTTFTSSNKNNDPISDWIWGGGNVQSKADLSNIYAYAAVDRSGDLNLYFGLERLDPSGDSHIDIEINQSQIFTQTDGTFTSSTWRQVNDLLLVMDFTKGGDLGLFEIRSWDGTEWVNGNNQSINGEGCYDGDTACAFNNNTEIEPGTWPSY
ncbi:MAG: hypothetical protein PVG32_20470, partial [Anaerolineales bacterium]